MLGDLTVKIGADIAEFKSKMKSVTSTLESTGKKMQSIGKSMTLGVTLPIVGIGGAMIKAASDAEETQQKFEVVFGNMADAANEASDELVRSFGLSRKAANQLLGDTGDILTGFGFTQEAALDLSEEVNKLAVDLASFTNFSGGAEGASKALTKALLGEAESVKALGIVIRQDTEEYKDMIAQTMQAENVSRVQAKALVALQIATEQSKNAVGDFARTQDSFANQMRVLKERIKDVAVEFGNELLPIAKDMVTVAKNLVDGFSSMSGAAKRMALTIAGVAAIAGPTLLFFGSLFRAVSSLSLALPKLTKGIKTLTSTMVANPYLAVAAAVALMATKVYFAVRAVKDLNEQIQDSLTLKVNADALGEVNETIKNVKSEIKELQESDTQGMFGKSLKDVQRLEELNAQLDKLKAKRSDIAMGLLNKELEENPPLANSASQATDSLVNSYKNFSVAVNKINDKPILDPLEIDRMNQMKQSVQNLYTPLTQLMDVPESIPEKMAPPGSFGFLQQSLANLRMQLQTATDPEVIQRLLNKIRETRGEIGEFSTDAAKTGFAMAGLASSVGDIFSRAVLHGKKLGDVVGNLLKQFASNAFIFGLSTLLSGGLSGFKDVFKGGFFKGLGKIIGVNDALITSGGDVVKFHPDDNILAMKDFGNLSPSMGGGSQNVHVTVSGRLDGKDIYVSGERGGIDWNR